MGADELVDLVDARDRVVGEATLERCLEKGLLHRAVAILVVRRNGAILLQQRSKHDRWHPGLWTISCTGHVRKGEAYDAAARRELLEELGVDEKPKLVKTYRLKPIVQGALTEHERVAFFTCRTESPVTPDPTELEAVREVSLPELRLLLRRGPLTPDAKLILTDFLKQKVA